MEGIYNSPIKAITLILFTLTLTSPAIFAHGMLNEQIADVSRKLEETPQNHALRIRRAELHRMHDDYAAAKADLRIVLDSADGPISAALILARLEREHLHFKSASKTLEAYFSRGGDVPEAFREKALIETALHRPKQSMLAWDEYLNHANTPTADEFHAAAMSHVKAGLPDSALKVVENGLQAFPRSVSLHHGAASILIDMGRPLEAESKLSEVKDHYPALLPRLYFDEGVIWEERHFPEKSEAAFQSAVRQIMALPPAKQNSPGMRKLSALLIKKLSP